MIDIIKLRDDLVREYSTTTKSINDLGRQFNIPTTIASFLLHSADVIIQTKTSKEVSLNKIDLPMPDIIKDFKKGMTIAKLADKYFVSTTTISLRLRDYGFSPRKYKVSQLEKMDPKIIRDMYWKQKMNLVQIARELSVTASSIRNFMVVHDIPRRRKNANSKSSA